MLYNGGAVLYFIVYLIVYLFITLFIYNLILYWVEFVIGPPAIHKVPRCLSPGYPQLVTWSFANSASGNQTQPKFQVTGLNRIRNLGLD